MPVLIDNRGNTEPAVNLALEQYCLDTLAPGHAAMLLFINDPAVVLGKHQCVFAEVDLTVAARDGIAVTRRISGGGAVYHDRGNLNFSFIGPFDRRKFGNYAAALQPVMATLAGLGLPISLVGKSDLFIAGRKVSGNAQWADTRRMLCHGTLLFDADLDRLGSVLTPSVDIMAARGVASIRSPVARIRDHLPEDMTMADFVKKIREGLMRRVPLRGLHELTPDQWQDVHRLADDRYRRWEWNIGRSPWCRVMCRVPSVHGGPGLSATVEITRGVITEMDDGIGSQDRAAWMGRRFEALLAAGGAISQASG